MQAKFVAADTMREKDRSDHVPHRLLCLPVSHGDRACVVLGINGDPAAEVMADHGVNSVCHDVCQRGPLVRQ